MSEPECVALQVDLGPQLWSIEIAQPQDVVVELKAQVWPVEVFTPVWSVDIGAAEPLVELTPDADAWRVDIQTHYWPVEIAAQLPVPVDFEAQVWPMDIATPVWGVDLASPAAAVLRVSLCQPKQSAQLVTHNGIVVTYKGDPVYVLVER